ncbi:MAG: sigma 54-interacting transcriptional regulator [candidate division Zixibacteria bacterium]|nr:sigma 54-interacting transcriptional regulator [candidate division Zixibacteria bacterium]MBU1470092.1 sigma 54-interacting transcriptional regulator [candidate division Zixibacteria bacterium]MBU2624412.1 sigma 54-interacting transcriptional regulator [candidate division Zixibacteria bacterium]
MVSRTFNVTEQKVEKLISESNYSEALALIEQLRNSVVKSNAHMLKARMFYLHSKCLFKLGKYREALLKIRSAARIVRATNDNAFLADIKHVLGLILIRLGRFGDAEEALTESYVFYKRTLDYKSLFFPLSHMAQLHYITGNFRRSCEVLELTIRYAAKYHSQDRVDNVKRNLARVLTYMGQFQKASTVLDSVSPSPSDLRAQASSTFLEGMIAVFRLQAPLGQCHIECALRLFSELKMPQDINVCLEYLGLLSHFESNYAKARECYQKVLDMPEPTASAVAQTLRMLTDVYIAEEKFDIAEETAIKAEASITKISERIELGALYRAYGQIYAHKKENDSARDYFSKSIDLLREIGARYELALSYLAAGKSESYSFDERMRHLEMSRMLFIEMDVPKRVEQVDDAVRMLRLDSIPDVIQSDSEPVIIAGSKIMKKVLVLARSAAESDINVLLTGETGTGKDLLARYVHCQSGRTGEFITVNAAAIPDSMVEAELFGCRKGSFTGAEEHKRGLIEAAEGGTFYLNEIADATLVFQAKLLEVLETHEVRRLGETTKRKVDFRLISATNHDIKNRIAESEFRADLFHRLKELQIELPTLRQRLEEIPFLLTHFARQLFPNADNDSICNLSKQVPLSLTEYEWPGNVREFRAFLHSCAIESNGDYGRFLKLLRTVDRHEGGERDRLERILKETRWNRRATARRLGVSEGTVRNRIKKFRLSP